MADHELTELENTLDQISREADRYRPLFILGVILVILSLGGLSYTLWQRNQRLEAALEQARYQEARAQTQAARAEVTETKLAEVGDAPDPRQAAQVALRDLRRLPSDFRVDIFYCTSQLPRSRELAEQLAKSRPADKGSVWRVRGMGERGNARSRYRATSNQIRYESGEELFADFIAEIAREDLGIELEMRKRGTVQPSTPGYVSVFFCEGARPSTPVRQRRTATN